MLLITNINYMICVTNKQGTVSAKNHICFKEEKSNLRNLYLLTKHFSGALNQTLFLFGKDTAYGNWFCGNSSETSFKQSRNASRIV